MFLTDTICIVIQEEEVLGPISVQFAEHAGEESAQHSVMLQCPINDTATPCEQCTACSGMPGCPGSHTELGRKLSYIQMHGLKAFKDIYVCTT